jgi:hypothetical protein
MTPTSGPASQTRGRKIVEFAFAMTSIPWSSLIIRRLCTKVERETCPWQNANNWGIVLFPGFCPRAYLSVSWNIPR